ncbi:IS3 family transposase [Aminobacter sp. NyZ550]|uniref:IS3 family transposase n=1 Tax=Aminobacter sp. NyZ550 TaxID=2979870 RepID=UPI003FA408A8
MSKASDVPFSRVEVITSVQRRRRWSVAEKVSLVEEAMQPCMSESYVARRAFLLPSCLPRSVACSKAVMPLSRPTKMLLPHRRCASSKSAFAIGADAGPKDHEKRDPQGSDRDRSPKKHSLPLGVLERCRGRFPVSAIARTLGIARSNQSHRTAAVPIVRRGPYRKPEDADLLAEIRPIIDRRPTYGYRLVIALINRQRRLAGKPTVNAQRVLRVMRQHHLTLQRHTAQRPGRTHDGR